MLRDAHDYTEDNTFVGWIPIAHDWGLINNVFQGLYSGALSVLMPPEVFLKSQCAGCTRYGDTKM